MYLARVTLYLFESSWWPFLPFFLWLVYKFDDFFFPVPVWLLPDGISCCILLSPFCKFLWCAVMRSCITYFSHYFASSLDAKTKGYLAAYFIAISRVLVLWLQDLLLHTLRSDIPGPKHGKHETIAPSRAKQNPFKFSACFYMQTYEVSKPGKSPGFASNKENSLENPVQGFTLLCSNLAIHVCGKKMNSNRFTNFGDA